MLALILGIYDAIHLHGSESIWCPQLQTSIYCIIRLYFTLALSCDCGD